MRKFLSTVLVFLLGLLLLVFLVANQQPVTISFDPLSDGDPALAFRDVPLWVAMAASLFAGYLLGGAGMWYSARGTRQKASARKREIKDLKREIETVTASESRGETLPAVRR